MSQVVCYLRVSTSEQADSGLGLAAQRTRLEFECSHRSWSDVIFIEDAGYSAKSLDRPGITRALELLGSGQASTLVVSRLDRLSRSLLDFAGLMDLARREGWQIVCLDLGVDTSSPAGEMMASVLASFAQYERRLISQRTRQALAVKRSQGCKLGRPIRLDPEIRQFIVRARSEGYTMQSIADTLNNQGIPTVSGRKWASGTINAVLRSIEKEAQSLG